MLEPAANLVKVIHVFHLQHHDGLHQQRERQSLEHYLEVFLFAEEMVRANEDDDRFGYPHSAHHGVEKIRGREDRSPRGGAIEQIENRSRRQPAPGAVRRLALHDGSNDEREREDFDERKLKPLGVPPVFFHRAKHQGKLVDVPGGHEDHRRKDPALDLPRAFAQITEQRREDQVAEQDNRRFDEIHHRWFTALRRSSAPE